MHLSFTVNLSVLSIFVALFVKRTLSCEWVEAATVDDLLRVLHHKYFRFYSTREPGAFDHMIDNSLKSKVTPSLII